MDTIINFDEAYCDGKLGHRKGCNACIDTHFSCTKTHLCVVFLPLIRKMFETLWLIFKSFEFSLYYIVVNNVDLTVHCSGSRGGPVAWVVQGPRRMALVFHDEISCRVTDRLPIYLNSPQTSEISSWCSNDFLRKTTDFYNNYLWVYCPISVELIIAHVHDIFL